MLSPQNPGFYCVYSTGRYCVNYKRLGERATHQSGNDAAHITQYHKISCSKPSLSVIIRILSDLEIQLFPLLPGPPRPRLTLLSIRPCLIKLPPPPTPYMFPQPGSASLCPHIAANIYIKLICIHSHIVRAIYNGSPRLSAGNTRLSK